MKEVVTIEAEGSKDSKKASVVGGGGEDMGASSDMHNRAIKILSAREAYKSGYDEEELEKPSKMEVLGCQLQVLPQDPARDWAKNHHGLSCTDKEITLYSKLTERTIRTSGSRFSSLEWTSIGWATGLALAAPILGFVSFHLDGHFPTLITAAATGVGVFFCLPAGLFKVTKIFIPYIAFIAAASTVSTASHTHHLGHMIRAYTAPTLKKNQFHMRQGISSGLSLYATAAGSFGSAIISAFTYHMLREPKDHEFISLWVVSIFSGLKWLVGIIHCVTACTRTSASISFSSKFHPFSIFKYPHAIGAIVCVFLSSFTSMCIFVSGVIFIVGQLCIKPLHLLFFWLIYFCFPLVSLPLLQPLQQLVKANSVKMQVLGFLLSILSSGFGFYFSDTHWKWRHLLVFGAIQSTSNGVLHAFGRILVLDCAPSGKEGAFSIWFAWIRAIGLCAGFAVGSGVPGRIRPPFGASFCTALAGIVVLLFGNVSDVGGAEAAGNVVEDSERESHVSKESGMRV
ncbi:putative transmembrane protein [Senna tora]|uniref:Putative transmembrane protein n=1 Tax=Senna tora TaxID=362788 RepID=A0A834STI1_9FABA|nr:putative transmembrane protein [Senna tora]